MNTALQEAIIEAYAVAPVNKVVYHTLEVRQIGVQGSVFMVQSRREIIAQDEEGDPHTFEPVGFHFSLPPSNEEGFKSLTIVIDNIDRRVTDFINIAKTSRVTVEAIYRPYLSDDLTTPQMIPPLVLYLKEVSMNALQVTGRATFMDLVNKRFPLELYTRDRFPSLG